MAADIAVRDQRTQERAGIVGRNGDLRGVWHRCKSLKRGECENGNRPRAEAKCGEEDRPPAALLQDAIEFLPDSKPCQPTAPTPTAPSPLAPMTIRRKGV